MRKLRRFAKPQGSSLPWIVGALVLVAGGIGLAAASSSGPARPPAGAREAPPVAAESDETRYVSGRAADLVSEATRGMPSGMVSDDALDRMKASARKKATREWAVVSRVYQLAGERGRATGEPDVYREAAGMALDVLRDLAGSGVDVPDEQALRMIEASAEKARLEARIRR
jgi:hypothetical protein